MEEIAEMLKCVEKSILNIGKTRMKSRLPCLICILGLCFISHVCVAQSPLYGVLTPEMFGANGDDAHDDTWAIQSAIDSLVTIGGGTIRLGSGTYLVTTLRVGPKVSIVGNGNGATVIKQKKEHKGDCLIVKDNAAALKIADLTIVGEDENCGLFFEKSGGFGENHPYVYKRSNGAEKSQGYKWITIDNICIYHFGTGLHIERSGYNINIYNSTFSHNVNGVIMKCTDSSMYNCYITNNKRDGLHLTGSNSRISNVKSIFNGSAAPNLCGAFVIHASRCQIVNCEAQDNHCKGFFVDGHQNLISNCSSNTDGYDAGNRKYNPSADACGFLIKGLYNTFSNCTVTSYTDKYGATYYSPIIVDDAVAYYYPDILNDIKVMQKSGMLLFHEPLRNVQALSSKNDVEGLNVREIDGHRYFFGAGKGTNVIKDIDVSLSSLQLLVDFRSMKQGGEMLRLDSEKDMRLAVEKSSIVLYWNGKKEAVLQLDADAVMNKDDLRLIVGFSQFEKRRIVSMTMFEKTSERGWIKKEVRQETKIPSEWMRKVSMKLGDSSMPVKRLAMSQSPLPEAVFMPSSNTNIIYSSAVVYVDVDTSM